MYGTRDAPLSWQLHLSERLRSLGFVTGTANPCVLFNKTRNLQLVYHVDGMHLAGEPQDLDWFEKEFGKMFECT